MTGSICELRRLGRFQALPLDRTIRLLLAFCSAQHRLKIIGEIARQERVTDEGNDPPTTIDDNASREIELAKAAPDVGLTAQAPCCEQTHPSSA